MPFEANDVYVGMIAYFTVNQLRRTKGIWNCATSADGKPRPFICYAEGNGLWYWTYLTSTWKKHRPTVARKWLHSAFGRYGVGLFGDLILSDPHDGFVGPAELFAVCSRKHDDYEGALRPILLPEGVEEVRRAVRSWRGPMPGRAVTIAPRREDKAA